MIISMEPIIYGVIFVAVLLLVEGIYLTVFGKSISLNSRVNRRYELLEKGSGNREEVLNQLRKEMSQHLQSRKIPLYSVLAEKAQKANIAFSPKQLLMIMVLLGMVAFVGLSIGTSASMPIRVAVSVLMGIGAVYVWIQSKAKKRLALIEEQLPDAVELMVRSLRVGHPFSNALNIVAKEVPDPLGTEMGVIADESAYGREVGEALKDMAERLDMQDLRFLAVGRRLHPAAIGREPRRSARRPLESDPLALQTLPSGESHHRRGAMVRQVPLRLPASGAAGDLADQTRLLRFSQRHPCLHPRLSGGRRLPRCEYLRDEKPCEHQGLRRKGYSRCKRYFLPFWAINSALSDR